MKMKKVVSAALAGAMALSLSVTAFADDPTAVKIIPESTESEYQVDLEGMIYTPTIRVQVTDSGSVYVNPAQSVVAGTMVKALDGTENLNYSFSDMGVVSTPILIRSDTDKPLTVNATATATVSKDSKVVLTDATIGTNEMEKKVSLFVTGSSTALGNSAALKDVTGADGKVTAGLTEDKLESTTATTTNKLTVDADKNTAATAKPVEVASIDAATQTEEGGKATKAVPQYGVVVVGGASAGKAKWAETDIVNVSVALTFAIDAD